MDGIEVELDRLVTEAERVADAARKRRDAFRQRIIQKNEDAYYLTQFATWLARETASCNCSAPSDVVRLREIAKRLEAIVIQE